MQLKVMTDSITKAIQFANYAHLEMFKIYTYYIYIPYIVCMHISACVYVFIVIFSICLFAYLFVLLQFQFTALLAATLKNSYVAIAIQLPHNNIGRKSR